MTSIATLTPTQRLVLLRLGEGRTDKQIAEGLGFLPGTAKKHVDNLRRKAGHKTGGPRITRIELVLWGQAQGFLAVPGVSAIELTISHIESAVVAGTITEEELLGVLNRQTKRKDMINDRLERERSPNPAQARVA